MEGRQHGGKTDLNDIGRELAEKYGFDLTLHHLVMVSRRDPVARYLLTVLPIVAAQQEFLSRIHHAYQESVLSEMCYQVCNRYLGGD